MRDQPQIHTTQKQLHQQATTSERKEAAMMEEAVIEMDVVEDPVENLKVRCLAKGVTGLLDFGRVVRRHDYTADHTLNLEEMVSLMDTAGLGIPANKVTDLFNALGGKTSGRIDIHSLIAAARAHLSPARLKVVREAFNQLDQSGSGSVSVADIRRGLCVESHPRFHVGQETKEEIVDKFVSNFHNATNCLDKDLTEEEFINYYSGVSATIDDDGFFDLMMRQTFRLEHSTERLYHETATNKRESDLVSASLSEVDSATDPLAKLRSHCLAKGVSGILQLGRLFRRALPDPGQKLGLDEFTECLTEAVTELSSEEIRALFEAVKDEDGLVGASSLMAALRPPMSAERRHMVANAFKKLDRSGDGVLSAEDFRRGICVDHHPRYLVGDETKEEVADKLLARFHSPGWDGKVTEDDFLDFYSAESSTVDNDGYFDLMMRQSFKL